MKKLFLHFFSFLFLFGFHAVYASYDFPPQLAVNILQSPTPLIAQGKDYLVYELYLTNFHTEPLTLDSLTVTGSHMSDRNFSNQEFAKLIHAVGVKKDPTPLVLQPGSMKMVFMWLPFDNLTLIPSQLIHQITYKTTHDKQAVTLTVTVDPLTITKTLPIVVSAPLHGDHWLAGNGPSNTSDHRKANLVVNGHDYFAQRYAIDFVQTGPDGTTYHGDEHKNESYYCYGKDVIAVAPGVITEVKDGIPENVPHIDKHAVPMTMDTVGGNHVIIKIAHGKYAFYAHLIPGSIKVKVGDKVKRGLLLGKVGNSGNSSEPHLHFHIVDGPSFLAANGIPYAFDHFDIYHSKMAEGDAMKVEILDEKLQHEINQLVLENTLMKFSK